MKLLFAILSIGMLAAQTPPSHSATLVWTDPSNPAGTTYSVYRAPGLCSGTPVFAKIATGVAVKTFTDTSVTPGNFCFAVTATFQGVESGQSPEALASVPTFAPANLQVTVQ